MQLIHPKHTFGWHKADFAVAAPALPVAAGTVFDAHNVQRLSLSVADALWICEWSPLRREECKSQHHARLGTNMALAMLGLTSSSLLNSERIVG